MFWHNHSRVETGSVRWPLHMAAPFLTERGGDTFRRNPIIYLAGDRHRCAYGQSRRRVGVAWHSAFLRMRAYPDRERHFDNALSSRQPSETEPEFRSRRSDLGPFNPIPNTSHP